MTYFYPGPRWDQVLLKRPPIVQMNPASGPGLAVSATYQAQVAKAKAAGAKMYGYVHTMYSARPVAEVKADVDKYVSWYGVDGIFVDTTANTLAALPYYRDLCGYIRSKGLRIVLNPGTKTIEEHAALADHIMVSETDAVTYRGQVRPNWEIKYPPQLFWHVVHSCPAAEMPSIVALAKSRNAGLVYVTDDVMANPYDTLPTYLDALCQEIAR